MHYQVVTITVMLVTGDTGFIGANVILDWLRGSCLGSELEVTR